MVGIASDAVVVHHALLTAGKGLGVQIKAGASPTVRDSVFYGVTAGNANPPAALHIQGAAPLLCQPCRVDGQDIAFHFAEMNSLLISTLVFALHVAQCANSQPALSNCITY